MHNQSRQAGGVWAALPWSVRYVAVVSACALLVAGLGYLLLHLAVLVAPLTLAVVAALIMAALLEPLVGFIGRLGLPRAVCALAAVVLLAAVIILTGLLVWPTTADQLGDLPGQLSRGWAQTKDWLSSGPLGINPEWLDTAAREASAYARRAVAEPAAFAVTLIEAASAALLALVLLFFLLKDGRQMAQWLVRLAPAGSRSRWTVGAQTAWTTLGRYARGTVIVAAVDALGIGLALLLIGVPLVLPLALLTFFAAFIPILGATTAGALATIVALAANGPVDALLTLVAVIAVQQLEGNLLEPVIMGRALRLHPAVVLVAVTAGALTGGVAGALVAVPLTAVIYKTTRAVLDHPPPAAPVEKRDHEPAAAL